MYYVEALAKVEAGVASSPLWRVSCRFLWRCVWLILDVVERECVVGRRFDVFFHTSFTGFSVRFKRRLFDVRSEVHKDRMYISTLYATMYVHTSRVVISIPPDQNKMNVNDDALYFSCNSK